jgi:hypothetical protein
MTRQERSDEDVTRPNPATDENPEGQSAEQGRNEETKDGTVTQ